MSKIEVASGLADASASTNGSGSIDQRTLFKELSDELEADLFVYSGPIERAQAGMFVEIVEANKHQKNLALVICTLGGDADAAYIMARFARSAYEKFILFVFGHCKSAGTLIALGADEIVMSHRGELGPLDVQLLKTDELLFRGSGLDVGKAIESLSENAFQMFERYFISLISKGGGAITTKTAAEIATSLSVGLISPITAQIDPLRVGEVERAINIANEYGTRLNASKEKVHALIHQYPSHSFVIDFKEASALFGNVRPPNEAEQKLEQLLHEGLRDDDGRKCIRQPHSIGIVAYLEPRMENQNEPERDTSEIRESEPVAAESTPSAGGSGGEREGNRGAAESAQFAGEDQAAQQQAEGTDGERRQRQSVAHQAN
jgi:hypothetical protein